MDEALNNKKGKYLIENYSKFTFITIPFNLDLKSMRYCLRLLKNRKLLEKHGDGGTETHLSLCYCEQSASTYNSIEVLELAQWQRTRLLLFQQLSLSLFVLSLLK